jgi:hypothetical protein
MRGWNCPGWTRSAEAATTRRFFEFEQQGPSGPCCSLRGIGDQLAEGSSLLCDFTACCTLQAGRLTAGALNAPHDALQPQTSNGEERELLAAARVGTTAVVRLLAASADATAFCLGHGAGAYQGTGGAPAGDRPFGRFRLGVVAAPSCMHQGGAAEGLGALPWSVWNPDEDSEHPRVRIAVGRRVRGIRRCRRRYPCGSPPAEAPRLLSWRQLDCRASGGESSTCCGFGGVGG